MGRPFGKAAPGKAAPRLKHERPAASRHGKAVRAPRGGDDGPELAIRSTRAREVRYVSVENADVAPGEEEVGACPQLGGALAPSSVQVKPA
jgi:hypothetical protein